MCLTGDLESHVPKAHCPTLTGAWGELRAPHWALHLAWEPLISEQLSWQLSVLYKSNDHWEFIQFHSWMASFPGKIMYWKWQKKNTYECILPVDFLWNSLVRVFCPLFPDFGDTLSFKLVECWSSSRVCPFSCSQAQSFKRSQTASPQSQKLSREKWSKSAKAICFCILFILVFASIAPSNTLTDFASVCHCTL